MKTLETSLKSAKRGYKCITLGVNASPSGILIMNKRALVIARRFIAVAIYINLWKALAQSLAMTPTPLPPPQREGRGAKRKVITKKRNCKAFLEMPPAKDLQKGTFKPRERKYLRV